MQDGAGLARWWRLPLQSRDAVIGRRKDDGWRQRECNSATSSTLKTYLYQPRMYLSCYMRRTYSSTMTTYKFRTYQRQEQFVVAARSRLRFFLLINGESVENI